MEQGGKSRTLLVQNINIDALKARLGPINKQIEMLLLPHGPFQKMRLWKQLRMVVLHYQQEWVAIRVRFFIYPFFNILGLILLPTVAECVQVM